jgi:hypothetical protein
VIEYVAPLAVTSPCIGICAVDDETGRCDGCARTLDEIAGWTAMGPERREQVMGELPGRKNAA